MKVTDELEPLGFTDFFISVIFLIVAVLLYFSLGMWSKVGFPWAAVYAGLPLGFVIWGISALVQPKKYFSWYGFLGGAIFGTTAMTGMFILLFWKSGVL